MPCSPLMLLWAATLIWWVGDRSRVGILSWWGFFSPLARGWELRVECSINWSTIHIIIFLIEGLNRKTIERTLFFLRLNILSENSHLVNVKKRAKALADYPENLRKFCDSLIHHIDNWNKTGRTENHVTARRSSCFDRNEFCSFGIMFIQSNTTASV